MKKKIILVFAIILFLAIVAWMFRDLFTGSPELQKNPYDYGMKELRQTDTVPAYKEVTPLKPALTTITSIATGYDGKIYVAGKGGVDILDISGRILKSFTFPGYATCLTVMPDNTLVIGMGDHVELWDPSGVQISAWQPEDTTSVITSVAASQHKIFVADAGNKIVYQYNELGKLQARIGEKDPSRKIPGFVIPSPYFDVGISPAGELWVANTGRYKLEKYDNDGSLLTSWGEASVTLEGFAGCCNPSHFTILSDGSFVTSEKGIERVKVYSPDGNFIALVARPESFDEGTRGLDLAAGSNGRILILDPLRNQVRVFLPLKKH
ncbi:MAG: NHL repeat-containing protein [Bacteroidetes bacterium]|nr:NHL repeat-containing protein [Bacteroidota bacterium]